MGPITQKHIQQFYDNLIKADAAGLADLQAAFQTVRNALACFTLMPDNMGAWTSGQGIVNGDIATLSTGKVPAQALRRKRDRSDRTEAKD
ncbi:MAG TPA: hypothetical protein VGL53_16730 [Bryobacteraceae bacterium]|jgi:hypothetical protein